MKIFIIKILRIIIYFLSLIIPKSKKIIIFGGRDGLMYGDNSRYLFIYCIKNFPKFKYIWLTKSPEIFRYLNKKGFRCYYSNSFTGIFFCLIANWHIFSYGEKDISDHFIFNVKKINLWHGSALKILKNKIRLKNYYFFFKSKYFCVYPNSRYSKNILNYLNLDSSNLIISNFPRNEILINKKKSLLKDYRTDEEMLLLNKMKNNSFNIGYFPTFRKSGIDLIIKNSEYRYIDILNKILIKYNSYLYYKSHGGLTLTINHKYFNNNLDKITKNVFQKTHLICLKNNLDLNSILGGVDVLISDYSGVIVDYLLLDRPIILYVPDLADYKKDCGLIIDYEKIDFAYTATSFKKLVKLLNDFLDDPKKFSDYHSNNRKKNINKFIKNKDPFKLIIDRLQN